MKVVAALMYVSVRVNRSAGCWMMSVFSKRGQGVSPISRGEGREGREKRDGGRGRRRMKYHMLAVPVRQAS